MVPKFENKTRNSMKRAATKVKSGFRDGGKWGKRVIGISISKTKSTN